MAVEKCFKILEIYYVYEYKVIQFNPYTDEGERSLTGTWVLD